MQQEQQESWFNVCRSSSSPSDINNSSSAAFSPTAFFAMEKQNWHKCRRRTHGSDNTRRWDISQSRKLWIKQQKYWPSSGAEFDSLSAFLYPHESSWIIARPKYFPEFMFFNVDKSKSWLFLTFRIFSSAISYCTCHSIRHFNFPFLSSQFFMIFHLKYFPILFLFSLETLFLFMLKTLSWW